MHRDLHSTSVLARGPCKFQTRVLWHNPLPSCSGLRSGLVHRQRRSFFKVHRSFATPTVCAISAAPMEAQLAEQLPTSVAIFTTAGCQYCKRAKQLLSQQGVQYQEIDLSGQLDLLNALKAATARQTVPQVFIAGSCIGGAQELEAAIGAGSFSKALQAASESRQPPLPQELAKLVASARGAQKAQGFVPAGCDPGSYKTLKDIAASFQSMFGGGSLTIAEAVRQLKAEKAVDSPLDTLRELQQAQLLYVANWADINLERVTSTSTVPVQLAVDAPMPKLGDAMNVGRPWFGAARDASEVSESLRSLILQLYDKHLAPDGRSVDYKALAADPLFSQDYVTATAELQKVDLFRLSREERIAFFINMYNALVLHAIVLYGPAETSLARLTWFSSIKYNMSGIDFSSNDIEHGVLRGNAKNPASVGVLLGLPFISPPTFKKGDPRLPLVVNPLDRRIHFALVCGAVSCPVLNIYSKDTLEEGLEAATAAFLEGDVEVDMAGSEVRLSMIFKWFRKDFMEGNNELLQWIAPYLPHDKQEQLQSLIAQSSAVKISHKPYDWAINST